MQVPVRDVGGLERMDTRSQAEPKPNSPVQESKAHAGSSERALKWETGN